MVAELKNYQSQVQAYKFEIERVNGQIAQTKDAYYQLKRQNALGIVPEMDDEYQDDQGVGADGMDPNQPYYQDGQMDQQEMYQQQMQQQQMQQ